MAEVIRISGLKEFRRELRKLDRSLPRGLKAAGNESAQIVVREAKPRVPRKTGRAAGSIRVSSTATAARVSGGSKRVSWYAWLDFGGRVGRRHAVRRPFLKKGRYIWAAFADNRSQVQKTLRSELAKLARDSGLGGI